MIPYNLIFENKAMDDENCGMGNVMVGQGAQKILCMQ
jgi:hypothetical protein